MSHILFATIQTAAITMIELPQSSSLNQAFYKTLPDNTEPPTVQLRNNRITEQQRKKYKNVKKGDEKMEVHTVGGRGGSPRTPIDAFNSPIVTCLARSMAWTTCCWC